MPAQCYLNPLGTVQSEQEVKKYANQYNTLHCEYFNTYDFDVETLFEHGNVSQRILTFYVALNKTVSDGHVTLRDALVLT